MNISEMGQRGKERRQAAWWQWESKACAKAAACQSKVKARQGTEGKQWGKVAWEEDRRAGRERHHAFSEEKCHRGVINTSHGSRNKAKAHAE